MNKTKALPAAQDPSNVRFLVIEANTGFGKRGFNTDRKQSAPNLKFTKPENYLEKAAVDSEETIAEDEDVADRSASTWEWPLAVQPKITNDELIFEGEFDVWPYSTSDVWVRIMGTDLYINIDPDKKEGTKKGPGARRASDYNLKPINRTYQLPPTIDHKSLKFKFVKDHVFRITGAKLPINGFDNDYSKLLKPKPEGK